LDVIAGRSIVVDCAWFEFVSEEEVFLACVFVWGG